jgi:hypothetical protein
MDPSLASEAERIFRQICDEALENRSPDRFNGTLSGPLLNNLDRPRPAASPRWQALQDDPIELQVAVALTAQAVTTAVPSNWLARQARDTAYQLVTLSLQRNLPLTEGELLPILRSWRDEPLSFCYGEPGLARLGAVERLFAGRAVAEEFRPVLAAIGEATGRDLDGPSNYPDYTVEVLDRIDRLLDPPATGGKALPAGAFAKALREWTGTLPNAEGDAWIDLAVHCAKARKKSRPDGEWLGVARTLVAKIDRGQFLACVAGWMRHTVPNPYRPDYSLDLLKGLLWLTGVLNDGTMITEIGRFCENCFAALADDPWGPEINKAAIALGKAAIRALSAMPDEPRAVAELFRLRDAIKQRAARKLIEARLAGLAAARGVTVEHLEDASAPDQESARRTLLLRLERSWIEDRSWTFADWSEYFLGHPLHGPIADALIWQIGGTAVMPEEGELRDVTGRGIRFGAADRVRLWHPAGIDPQQVAAWRARIMQRGISQPIEQVDRDIYAPTPAERKTRTYSNRFAARILDQHRFKTLCEECGWTYALLGVEELDWVDPDAGFPRRSLPAFGIKVVFGVELVPDDQFLDSAPLHIATDQVQFVGKRGRVLALGKVAPIVFSEVLREIGVLVAATSVGTQPDWFDRREAR